MTARSTRFMPEARIWSHEQVAARFGRSAQWLYENLPRLKQLGFPPKDQVLKGFDSKAVEAWFDRRSRLDSDDDIEAQMLEAIHGEDHASIP